MAFPCPACGAPVGRSPEGWALRCPACRALLRSRRVDDGGSDRVYEVQAAGRPDTRRRVHVPWTPHEQRRLDRWLLWASVLTLALVGVLFALARLG